jgi:hypothetical protein
MDEIFRSWRVVIVVRFRLEFRHNCLEELKIVSFKEYDECMNFISVSSLLSKT